MEIAVELAVARGAYAFFYQQHSNTYQIVGFFATEADYNAGTKNTIGANARGAVGYLSGRRQLQWGGVELDTEPVQFESVATTND